MSDTDAGIIAVDAVDLSRSSLLQTLVRNTLKQENLLASVVKRHSSKANDVKQSNFTSDTAANDKNLLEDKTFLKELSLTVARVLVENEEFIKLINEKAYERIAVLEKQLEQQCQLVVPIFVEHWGDNLQFYLNFALNSTLGGMNFDRDFVQVWKFSKDQKTMQMEHFFPQIQVKTKKKKSSSKIEHFFP